MPREKILTPRFAAEHFIWAESAKGGELLPLSRIRKPGGFWRGEALLSYRDRNDHIDSQASLSKIAFVAILERERG